MKTKPCCQRRFFAALFMLAVLASPAKSQETTAAFPHQVRYELGDAEFASGDRITIQEVRGTRNVIVPEETFSVEGTYTLSSRDEAELSLFATTLQATGLNRNPTPIDPKQTVRIQKGTGKFHLVKTMHADGYLHVSFYPVVSGSSFGGIYFGQGKWVLHKKEWRTVARSPGAQDPVSHDDSNTVALVGPNRALLEYLGNPVEPPADMDMAYTKDSLIKALQLAAQKAGVALKTVEVDDSEFPFLIGVECEENDFEKMKDQIKKSERYHYSGCLSSQGHYAFNLVPHSAFPSQSSQRIGRRLLVRQQVLFDRITRK